MFSFVKSLIIYNHLQTIKFIIYLSKTFFGNDFNINILFILSKCNETNYGKVPMSKVCVTTALLLLTLVFRKHKKFA